MGHEPVFILSEWASPGKCCPERLWHFHPWRYSEQSRHTLYDPTMSGRFGLDNLNKYYIDNSVIRLKVLQQPSPKELLHHGVHSGVGVYFPLLTPRKEKHLMEMDGRSITKLHQVLLKTAHCHNPDYSNFVQGNEIFQTIHDLTLTESNRKKFFPPLW